MHKATIKTVVNYTHVQSYKNGKYLNLSSYKLTNLPHMYITKNSREIAQELINKQISKQYKNTNIKKNIFMLIYP